MKNINTINNLATKIKTLIKTEKLAIFFLTLFVIECSLGGSGRWFPIGPLSLRYILFGISFLLVLPSAYRNINKLFNDKLFWVLSIFLAYVFFSALVGYLANNKLSFIISDFTGLLAVALLIPILAFEHKRQLLKNLTDAIIWGSFAMAAAVFVLHLILASPTAAQAEINIVLNDISLGGLAQIGYAIQRIFLRSQIFYQFAIVLCVLKIYLYNKEDKKWLIYAAALGVILFSLLLTYTRAFWFGSIISLVLFLVFLAINKGFFPLFKRGIAAALIIFVLLGVSCAAYKSTDVVNAAVGRVSTTEVLVLPGDYKQSKTDKQADAIAADQLRAATLYYTHQNILISPVFGMGLGKNLDLVRTDGKSEYVYWDMAMKMGLIGVTLMLLPYVMIIITAVYMFFLRKKASVDTQNIILTGVAYAMGLVGLMLTSYFNPFITNPLGISLILCTTVAVSHAKECLSSELGRI